MLLSYHADVEARSQPAGPDSEYGPTATELLHLGQHPLGHQQAVGTPLTNSKGMAEDVIDAEAG